MTAIEVLASTTLASLMLASVVGVLGTLARQERALRAIHVAPAWHARLAEQFSWDLVNSREFAATASGIRLVGFAGRDFVTGAPTGRPTQIDYCLVEAAGDRWLIRRESHSDARSSGAIRTELVCRGVYRFQCLGAVIDQVAASSTDRAFASAANRFAIPNQVTVQLFASTNETPWFEKAFLIR